MSLFTFVFEYKGGTYISQKSAENVRLALINWGRELDISEIDSLNEAGKSDLIKEINNTENELAPLDGLLNAWCQDVFIEGNMYLINIVQTVS